MDADHSCRSGLFWMLAIANVAVGLFAAANLRIKEGITLGEHRQYLMVPARAGARVIQMARRSRTRVRIKRDD